MPESGTMPAATDLYTAPLPTTPPDASSGGTMPALYRAALGPVNQDRYLALFARFDATGRASAGWNGAASLCTLNWMVFRHLWTAALVYVAAAEGLALLAFGLGRQLLQWPVGVEWGVLGALALLAFAVPGLFGDAILHADIRRRIARALAASRTVPEACALLGQRAGSRKRLQGLVLINLVLAAALALAYLLLPRTGLQGASLEPSVTVAEAASAAAAASAPADPEPPPAAKASEPETAPPATTAPTPEPAASAVQPPEAPAPAQAVRTEAPAPPATKPPATRAAPASRPAPAAKAKAGSASTPAPSAPAASDALPAPVGTAAGYYINVGLFAEEANARKAQARLLNEGLPAFRQELSGAKGRRIRVRVGPYGTRAQADAAAASIRAMALEAVVFKQ